MTIELAITNQNSVSLRKNLNHSTKSPNRDLYYRKSFIMPNSVTFVTPNAGPGSTHRPGCSDLRSGPVQFEKEEALYGIDKFLNDVRECRTKRAIAAN